MADENNKEMNNKTELQTPSGLRRANIIIGFEFFLFVNLYSVPSYSNEEANKKPPAITIEQQKEIFELIKKIQEPKSKQPSDSSRKPCEPVPISPENEGFKDLKRLPSGCPGYDDFDPGVLNMEMNGIKVNFPREYYKHLLPDADGPYFSKSLDMLYPDLSPTKSGQSDKKMEISVTLHAPLRNKFCSEGRCPHNSQRRYEIEALSFNYRGKHTKIEDYLPKKVDYIESINMNHFKNGEYDVYFRGDIQEPVYWFTCKVLCTPMVWFHDDRFAIKYRFKQKELLTKHDEMRNKLINKFEEFIQE